jgi:hypothetical protein
LKFTTGCFYTEYTELRRTLLTRESSSLVPWAVAPGAFLYSLCPSRRGCSMADHASPIQFEDVPLDEARRMGRGPRMDPQLYQELKTRIPVLSSHAVHMTIPEGTSPTTMKNRLLRIAAELRIPLTIRKVPGALLFWRSTAEDLAQAKEVAQRLQPAQRKGRGRPGQRRR